MKSHGKSTQLQLRVSEYEKRAIRSAAERAGMDMSEYVLARVLPTAARRFQESARALEDTAGQAYALAELNSFLAGCSASELREAVASAPASVLEPFPANYLAALVESACARRGVPVPEWVRRIPPLQDPVFGSQLKSVRLYLLVQSPPPFKRRNIFIDTDVGSRV